MKNPKSLHVKATAIKEEGKQLQQFLQLISDLWYVVSEDGYYQHLNFDRWENLLGWHQSELKAKPMLAFVHPEDAEATSKALSKLEKNQVTELNVRHRHQDGSFRSYCWRINKNEDELIYGIGKEITFKELEHQLKPQSYLVKHKSTDELLKSAFQKVEFILHLAPLSLSLNTRLGINSKAYIQSTLKCTVSGACPQDISLAQSDLSDFVY